MRLPSIPGSSGPDQHLTAPLCPPAGFELGRGGRAAFPPGGAPGAAPRSPARPAWRPKTRGPIKQRPTRHRAAGAPQGTAPVDARRPPWSACASGRRLEGTPVFDTTLLGEGRPEESAPTPTPPPPPPPRPRPSPSRRRAAVCSVRAPPDPSPLRARPCAHRGMPAPPRCLVPCRHDCRRWRAAGMGRRRGWLCGVSNRGAAKPLPSRGAEHAGGTSPPAPFRGRRSRHL